MAREARRVKALNRPAIYGRPQPVRSRGKRPEIKVNLRAILAGLILLVLVGWWWQTFAVKRITIQGSKDYASSLVTAAVNAQLHKHWWWHNLMLIDTAALQKDVLAAQPQLSDVAISRHWPSGLNLKVTEREPNLEWQTDGQTYLLSQDGVIVAAAGQSSLRLPVVVDSANLPVKLGDRVAPEQFVQFCLDMVKLLPKQGLQVTGMQVPTTTNEVYVTTNKGYYIKFDTTRDPNGEVGDLVRVLNLLKAQNKQPSQYIDLRIDGAAYYQ